MYNHQDSVFKCIQVSTPQIIIQSMLKFSVLEFIKYMIMQKMPDRNCLTQGVAKALEKNHFLIAVSGNINPRYRGSKIVLSKFTRMACYEPACLPHMYTEQKWGGKTIWRQKAWIYKLAMWPELNGGYKEGTLQGRQLQGRHSPNNTNRAITEPWTILVSHCKRY